MTFLKTQRYKFVLSHRKETINPADYFNRHAIATSNANASYLQEYTNFIFRNSLPNALAPEEVQQETQTYKILTMVISPINKNDHNLWNKPELKRCPRVRGELSVAEG